MATLDESIVGSYCNVWTGAVSLVVCLSMNEHELTWNLDMTVILDVIGLEEFCRDEDALVSNELATKLVEVIEICRMLAASAHNLYRSDIKYRWYVLWRQVSIFDNSLFGIMK